MSIDLSCLNILLTGASQGIGKTTADYLMTMGARVAVHYNSNKTAAKNLVNIHRGTKSQIFKADLNNIDEVITLFENVKKENVNNIQQNRKLVTNVKDELERLIDNIKVLVDNKNNKEIRND